MYSSSDYILMHPENMDIEEKKNLVHSMIEILEDQQLTEIIQILEAPYFQKKLKEYLDYNSLPPIDSPEFLFLVEAAKYNGNIVKRLLSKAGLSSYYIDKFIYKYELIEISKGLYVFPQKSIDAQFLFQAKYTKSVISHETALYLHDLSDVIPKKTIMSLPTNSNFKQFDRDINHSEYMYVSWGNEYSSTSPIFYFHNNDPIVVVRNNMILKKDISFKETYYGNTIKVTSPERTIADIFKTSSKVEEEIKYTSLRNYLHKNPDNSTRLLRIAKQQKVYDEIKYYLNFV